MLKSMMVAFGLVVLSAFASVGVSAEPVQKSVAVDGSYQVAEGYGWGARVCCKRGYRDWWTTRRDCRRSGGHVTYNRECRDRFDRIGDRRVCCARGFRDWWSTERQCRRAGGRVTYNRECRNG
jgi:hypothetical protein